MRKYTHHFDFISDFMWVEDKKQLVATRWVSYQLVYGNVVLTAALQR